MSVGSHNILSKCDRALVAYLISEGVGDAATIFPAKRSENKPIPCVVVFSERAVWDQAVYDTVNVSVMVKTNPCPEEGEDPDDVETASEELVSAVFDALFKGIDSNGDGSELAANITAAARDLDDDDMQEFTVQNVNIKGPEAGFDPKGNSWVDTLDLEMVVCPKDVS